MNFVVKYFYIFLKEKQPKHVSRALYETKQQSRVEGEGEIKFSGCLLSVKEGERGKRARVKRERERG